MFGRFSWSTSHHIEFGFLIGQCQSWIDVCSDADDQHEDVRKREWDLENDQSDKRPDLSHVRGKEIHNGLLQIIKDLSSLLNTVHNR